MQNLFSNEDPFPTRGDINKNKSYKEDLIDKIRSIDIENSDFKSSVNGGFRPKSTVIEKQKVYFWIRLYLKKENTKVKPDDDIIIKYIPSGEMLNTKFICYAKPGSLKDNDGQVTNYTPEDDKKVLCLMVDSDKINKDSEDIPFIRTLFKIGRHYEYQLLKREDLLFLDKSGKSLEYFDVDL